MSDEQKKAFEDIQRVFSEFARALTSTMQPYINLADGRVACAGIEVCIWERPRMIDVVMDSVWRARMQMGRDEFIDTN